MNSPDLPRFYELLHRRNLTVEALAGAIGSERSHVVRVLRRYPARGGNTRRKLAAILLAEELAALGWDAQGRIIAGPVPAACPASAFATLVRIVPRRTNAAGRVPCGTGGVAA